MRSLTKQPQVCLVSCYRQTSITRPHRLRQRELKRQQRPVGPIADHDRGERLERHLLAYPASRERTVSLVIASRRTIEFGNGTPLFKQAGNFGHASALGACATPRYARVFRWRPNEATRLKRHARVRTSVSPGKISPRSKPRLEGSMDQRLPASVSRVPFSLSSAQRGSDPLGFCQKFSLWLVRRYRDDQR